MGTVRYADAVANAMVDAIATVANAGTGPCLVQIYNGSMPATPATAITTQTLLAELTCSDPVETGAASSRTVTFDAITQDSSADASGTASWARIMDGAGGTALFDVDVGNLASSAGLKMSSTVIVAGQPVAITAFTIAVPTTVSF